MLALIYVHNLDALYVAALDADGRPVRRSIKVASVCSIDGGDAVEVAAKWLDDRPWLESLTLVAYREAIAPRFNEFTIMAYLSDVEADAVLSSN